MEFKNTITFQIFNNKYSLNIESEKVDALAKYNISVNPTFLEALLKRASISENDTFEEADLERFANSLLDRIIVKYDAQKEKEKDLEDDIEISQEINTSSEEFLEEDQAEEEKSTQIESQNLPPADKRNIRSQVVYKKNIPSEPDFYLEESPQDNVPLTTHDKLFGEEGALINDTFVEEPLNTSDEFLSLNTDAGYFGFNSFEGFQKSEELPYTPEGKTTNLIEESYYQNSEIIDSDYTSGVLFADSYENPVSDSFVHEISGTQMQEGIYENCYIISSNQEMFNSKEESSVKQPETIFINEVEDIPSYSEITKDNSNILSDKKEESIISTKLPESITDSDYSFSYLETASPINPTSNNASYHVSNGVINETDKSKVAKADSERIIGLAVNGNHPIDKTSTDKADIEKKTVDERVTTENIKETESARNIESGAVRKFSTKSDYLRSFCQTGELVGESLKHSAEGDDDATQGNKEFNRYKQLGGMMLDNLGAKSAMQMEIVHALKVENATNKAAELIASGKITQSDFNLSKNALKEQLEALQLSSKDIKLLTKYHSDIHTNLVTSGILRQFDAHNNNIFSEAEKIFLKENGLFNSAQSSEIAGQILRKYFSQSSDPFLQKINPNSMTAKQLKKLTKEADKFNIGVQDKTLLQYLYKKKRQDVKMKAGKSLKGLSGLKNKGSKALRLIQRIDSDATAGLNSSLKVYNGAKAAKSLVKLAYRGGVGTKRFIGRVTGLNYVAHLIKVKVNQKIQTVKNVAARKVKQTGKKVITAADKLKAVKHTKRKLSTVNKSKVVTKARKGITTASNSVKQATDTVKTVKTGYVKGKAIAKGRLRKVGNVIRKPLDVVLSPFRALGTLFKLLGDIKKKIILAVGGALLGFIVIYVVLVLIIGAIMGATNTISAANEGMIFSEDIAEFIKYLQSRDKDKFAEAEEIAKGRPISPYAFGGVDLYHYGSPRSDDDPNADMYHNYVPDSETENGFHIYYLDSSGQIIGNNTSNVKDIICLAAVMLGNNFDDSTLEEQMLLMEDLFVAMNPAVNFVESDLYNTEYSTDMYPYADKTYIGETYYCYDSDFYDKMSELEAEGAAFYDEPAEQTEYGCYCPGHEVPIEEESEETVEDNEMIEEAEEDEEETEEVETTIVYCEGCECDGHDPLHCSYGYRDINVYVTILSKEDVYAAFHNNGIIEYLVPTNYEATAFTTKQSVINLNKAAYSQYFEEFYLSDEFRYEGNVEWCNNLYDQDWYDLYGIDAFINATGLDVGGSMSEKEIEEIINSYEAVSEARRAFCDYAMSYVGSIKYYWGGKPCNAGTPLTVSLNGPTKAALGSRVKPDYKGRNVAGLDCSGFVGWAYWSTYGVKPGLSTSNFVPSLGLPKVSFNNLQPGDIGMIAPPGAGENHIGIFVGIDETGTPLWCHCSSSNGVTVSNYTGFRYYYQLFSD